MLVLTYHFTRWAEAIPVPDATAVVVAQALHESVFIRFDLTTQLHSNQRSQFKLALIEEQYILLD